MSKSRDISPYDFLQALQKEYICLEIRWKIYVNRADRDYFKNKMKEKEKSITMLAQKNRLKCIFTSAQEYLSVWRSIVPEYGLPKFIYNIVNVSEKQQKFPYTGTAIQVKVGDSFEYGVSHKVHRPKLYVGNVMETESTVTYYTYKSSDLQVALLSNVTRLSHEETDEFFYFYPGNKFDTNQSKIGELKKYDLKTKQAILDLEGMFVTLRPEDISRIL